MVVGAIKTLIIGSDGMFGSDLCKVFPDAVKLIHQDLDITDRDQVIESILKIKPDVVINTAAYTNVDGCEDNKELAFQVNGSVPGHIAEACTKAGAALVHFSPIMFSMALKKSIWNLTSQIRLMYMGTQNLSVKRKSSRIWMITG